MAKQEPNPNPGDPNSYACIFCGQPLELSAESVMGHMWTHGTEVQMEAVKALISTLIEQVDDDITMWFHFPEEQVRRVVESDLGKSALGEPNGGRLTDLLVIRLQCAEEFRRVAREYAGLLKTRQEMEI